MRSEKRWGLIINIDVNVPKDLFIPPDALEVLLDSFSGPLDLLLYLIRRDRIDIMDIPIVEITEQYMQYIDLMEVHRMALAVDYLVMAAMLAEIKSRLLLPVVMTDENEPEEDPRLELVRRLQVYEQFKQAAAYLEQLPRLGRDRFSANVYMPTLPITTTLPEVALSQIIEGYQRVLERQKPMKHHQIQREPLSVRERMVYVLQRLQQESVLEFGALLLDNEGRMGVIVSFLAILELAKQALLILTQTDALMPIHLQYNNNSAYNSQSPLHRASDPSRDRQGAV